MTAPPIQKLPDTLVAQIAAGEVIESPVGLIKELIENSIDAGATQISTFVHGAGYQSLQVRDNGRGIERDQLRLAVESFATSKISSLEEMQRLSSLGFRGEALSSIRSVSRMTIESKPAAQDVAYRIRAEVDQISEPEPAAMTNGTRIIVEDLFFNAPVRREFFDNEKTIRKQISEVITGFAILHPEIAFDHHYDDRAEIAVASAPSLLGRIEQLFGREFASGLMPVYWEDERLQTSVKGYVSNFSFYKSNASFIKFFVNGRMVTYKPVVGLLRHLYGEMLPHGRFPIAFLLLDLPTDEVDVNVHPQKKEIRFRHETDLQESLRKALRKTIDGSGPLRMRNLQHPRKSTLPTAEPQELLLAEAEAPALTAEPATETAVMPADEQDLAEATPSTMPFVAHARLFRTFVLASSENGIYLVDQHTAHERINFEQFLARLRDNQDVSQHLVAPVALHLSPAENSMLEQGNKLLAEIGFHFEDMGPAGWQLSAVPFYVKPGEEQSALQIALDQLEKTGGGQELSATDLFEEMAGSLACRHAIRKGDDVSVPDLTELLQKLEQCQEPGRCPHGRPTRVFLGRDEVFALFKRKPD